MMEAKHTPAPWRASEGAEGIIVNYVTDEDRPGSGVATICQVLDHDGSAVPDARLIAAAPDLLAACEELERVVGQDIPRRKEYEAELWAQLRAAIAKAKGE